MNAIAATGNSTLDPAMYEIGQTAARISMAASVLKEEVALPLARLLSRAKQSFEAGVRATSPLHSPPRTVDAEPAPLAELAQSPQVNEAEQASPLVAEPAAACPAARPARQGKPRAPRGAVHKNERRRAHCLRRRRCARRHRTRRPIAITAAVAEQIFHVTRRTLRRWVAQGWLRDLREPGRAQNAQLLLDLRQVAKQWPRRVGVKVSAEHWGLQMLDKEIFFAARPDNLRTRPDIDV